MSCATAVAHRAARRLGWTIPVIVALLVALSATVTVTSPAAAASYAPRVVIVVGPSGASTGRYLDRANLYADQARAYGAAVTEIYTPRATWKRVVAASQGANVFIYLGHGNGWPSPYGPYQGTTKDGLGLNPYSGSGSSSPVKYYGEDQIAAKIRFAPGAIVLLNHLCYASGNGEPGSPEPSWSTARRRADNYAAGFIKARAAAVLADGHSGQVNELHYLFGPTQFLLNAWRRDPGRHGHERVFDSARSPGFNVHLDPDNANSGFYRSLVTKSNVRTGGIRIAAWRGTAKASVVLRRGPYVSAEKVAGAGVGARLWVIGPARTDGDSRTWVPVITATGRRGYVAGWLVGYAGSALPRRDLSLRAAPKTTSARRAIVRAGSRVAILKSTRDSRYRVWLYVRTSSGKTGWMAAWLMKP